MNHPLLTNEEREAINAGRWFSSLSPCLRHDILRFANVEHYEDGALIAERGTAPEQWMACASGAARVCSTSPAGKQVTLSYLEPGVWFGDVAIFDGNRRTHDVYAHGRCTLLCVENSNFRKILEAHPELYAAMLRLQARRIRILFDMVEDLHTLPLHARLAKQLIHLARSYGVPSVCAETDIRIRLCLAQEELARLVSSSRQRVNIELKRMERSKWIRMEQGSIVVQNRQALLRSIANTASGVGDDSNGTAR